MTQRVEDNKDLDSRHEGPAAAWTVAIDESDTSEGWQVEIDLPHIYLMFQVANLDIILRGIELLQRTLTSEDTHRRHGFVRSRDEVALGSFNGAAVHLVRDNEDFPRCFLVIGPDAQSVLRLSLDEGAIRAFAEGLSEAVDERSIAAAPEGKHENVLDREPITLREVKPGDT